LSLELILGRQICQLHPEVQEEEKEEEGAEEDGGGSNKTEGRK